jgi:glycolate oxidase FAD binding subunit
VILETSFKILPRPARECTLRFACSQAEAVERSNRWSGQPLPLSAACWHRDELLIRLSGAASEVDRAARRLEPDEVLEGGSYWQDLREHRNAFFRQSGELWRLSLPPATAPLALPGKTLLDWGGAQRWYISDAPPGQVRELAARSGGHATLFRGSGDTERFHPLPSAMRALQRRIRQAFDPQGLFNPGRLGQNS